MKYLFSIILVVLSITIISAQGVYLNVGSNFTTYDYTNSLGGTGYFNENEDKGARKFFSLGAGFKYSTW